MQVVCETTQSTDVKVKVAALQCLVRIMSLYYQYMETYMGPALFAITLEAMKSDMDEVALQGMFYRKRQRNDFILASILKIEKNFQDHATFTAVTYTIKREDWKNFNIEDESSLSLNDPNFGPAEWGFD